MHYNEHVISDTKNLPTNTADIPHWAKVAQYQIACFGWSFLRAGSCLIYPPGLGCPSSAPVMLGALPACRASPPCASLHPRNGSSRQGWRALPQGRDIHSSRGDSEHPAGAGGKGSGGVFGDVSFPPRIISRKLCQLSTVKQILEVSINISRLEGEAAPITFGFGVLGAAPVRERRRPGIFLIVRRRKFPVKTNTHSPAGNATPGSNSVLCILLDANLG